MARRKVPEPRLEEGARLLDRYTILERVGSGGMASIYRAKDERLDRVVCVKLLRTRFDRGEAVMQATYEHFLKEALALSRLSHPNTLRIYDFGYLDESAPDGLVSAPFQVSEYLEGGNLETLVRAEGPLSPVAAVTMLESVTSAVAEAHEHGILHRDIKPSNILFARVRGELVPKLADFGIAHTSVRSEAEDTPPTPVSAVALFSPRWASPEQLAGAEEGPSTDVYALGLLTVFMLSGHVLFGDEDVRQTFEPRVRADGLVRERVAALDLPAPVADVLARAMARLPEERIASAPAFLEALRAAVQAPLAPGPREALAPRDEPRDEGEMPQARARVEPAAPAPAARYVFVEESLDLSFVEEQGEPVRVRVTMLPGGLNLNIKGLTCFVARPGQRPTPAVTATQDGALDLVSAARRVLGEVWWSLGTATPEGRAFVVDGRSLLVPYEQARRAVVVCSRTPGRAPDVIVMCSR